MSVARTVTEVIRQHVTLEVESIDRLIWTRILILVCEEILQFTLLPAITLYPKYCASAVCFASS